ncbi:MAG: hypothetical protein AB1331_06025 [Bacillota bacterium]
MRYGIIAGSVLIAALVLLYLARRRYFRLSAKAMGTVILIQVAHIASFSSGVVIKQWIDIAVRGLPHPGYPIWLFAICIGLVGAPLILSKALEIPRERQVGIWPFLITLQLGYFWQSFLQDVIGL